MKRGEIYMNKYNKPLDRAYFERKKDPKYNDMERLTKCCNQSQHYKTMMKNNKEDWKLIEDYIERNLYAHSNTKSMTPIFCNECGRFKHYLSEIDVNQTLGYKKDGD
jgi:hypothetical protein